MQFGVSQAPQRFSAVSVEFTQILLGQLAAAGVTDICLATYIDDLFFAAKDFPQLQQSCRICDALSLELGVSFKDEKDEGFEAPTQSIEWIGYTMDTRGGAITVRLSGKK